MSLQCLQGTSFSFTTVRDRLLMEVPWARAEEIRDRLAGRGITATACFEPADRRAFIEMPMNTSPDLVLGAL